MLRAGLELTTVTYNDLIKSDVLPQLQRGGEGPASLSGSPLVRPVAADPPAPSAALSTSLSIMSVCVAKANNNVDIRCAYLHGLDGCLMQGERVREEHHDHSSRAYLHVSDESLMQGERARAELSSYLREPLCTVQPRG